MSSATPDWIENGSPIARKVAEAHDGTVSVSSTVGEGSAFTVALPMS